jgi:hypothetical protein
MAKISQEPMWVNNGNGLEYKRVQVYRYEDYNRPGYWGPPQRDLTPYETREVANAINLLCSNIWDFIKQLFSKH